MRSKANSARGVWFVHLALLSRVGFAPELLLFASYSVLYLCYFVPQMPRGSCFWVAGWENGDH